MSYQGIQNEGQRNWRTCLARALSLRVCRVQSQILCHREIPNNGRRSLVEVSLSGSPAVISYHGIMTFTPSMAPLGVLQHLKISALAFEHSSSVLTHICPTSTLQITNYPGSNALCTPFVYLITICCHCHPLLLQPHEVPAA